jgi:hypothetical protein
MKYRIIDGSNSELGLHRYLFENFKLLEFDNFSEAEEKSKTIKYSYILKFKN